MEVVRPRKTKARRAADSPPPPVPPRASCLPPIPPRSAVFPNMTMTDLERRLDELPTAFDELPGTSTAATSNGSMEERRENGIAAYESSREEDEQTVSAADQQSTESSSHLPAAEARAAETSVVSDGDAAFVESEEVVAVPLPDLDLFPCSTLPPVSENPLSSILANTDEVDEATTEANLSNMYPRVSAFETPTSSLAEPRDDPPLYADVIREDLNAVLPRRQAPALPAKTGVRQVSEEPKVYPSLAALEMSDHGLMTENQLLAFYHNELYETTEDFVDAFIESEGCPNNGLFEYLERYKDVCEKIAAAEVEVAECEAAVKNCSSSAWVAEKHVCNQTGKCGEQRHATGSVEYLSATLHPEKVAELSALLKRDAKTRLDRSLCFEIEARSLALQIQWRIVDLNNAFMANFSVAANSAPRFIANDGETASRLRLRGALSDLFYFLRFPALPNRFVNSITGWISELCAVLLKANTYVDQHFLLCQVLRLAPPVAKWAAPLLQPYTNMSSDNDRLVIDNFIAMLSILLSPVRGRENFLRRIVNFEEDDSSWTMLSDDLDEGEISFAAVNETDMIAFLNQLRIESVFARAIYHFSSAYRIDAVAQVLSLTAFELVLLKLFNDGLRAYSHPRFRQFCKQIGYSLRQSVKYLAEFWQLTKNSLTPANQTIVQNEFDRIVLQALYYVVGKQSLGLWQFLVDLPYNAVSESCRLRCQILLRSKEAIMPLQLYEIPDSELPERLLHAGKLIDRLSQLSKDDSNYMVSALAAIVSVSESDIDNFVLEIFKVCFLDESVRENFYKVGSEATGVLIDNHPEILSRLLFLIDRNIDNLDQYAVEILATAPLSKCRLTSDDVGSICGKWLINRAPGHPASRIARRVLSSMNWGCGCDGNLWLSKEVHAVCAETIVKGHMAQCKHTNGLIAKSFNKIAKLASKVPDYEYQFETFCWDVLLRLKLSYNAGSATPLTDLTAYYVHIEQRCLGSANEFLSKGLSFWSDLVGAGCYGASCAILSKFLVLYPDSVFDLIANESFLQCFDRLLHCDQSSYAVQLIAGSDRFPGPTMKLLDASITVELDLLLRFKIINGPRAVRFEDAVAWAHSQSACQTLLRWLEKTVIHAKRVLAFSRVARLWNPELVVHPSSFPSFKHHLNENFSHKLLNAWVRLLCCRRTFEWNSDRFSLHLLGVLCEFAFERDQKNLLGLVDLFQEIYMSHVQQWKEASKGLLSWLTSDGSVPAAIPSSNLSLAPWTSYVLLLAEERSYASFYEALYASMAKHPKYSLEQCVKRAASKSHVSLPVEQLHFFRWLEFACAESVATHPCFPLVCQNLVRHVFSRQNVSGAKVCFAGRYFASAASVPLFDKLRKEILPSAEVNSSSDKKETAVFFKAVGQWLSNTALRENNFSAFDDLLLDHLVQFICAGDTHLWMQFVDMERLTNRRIDSQKLYASVRHWGVVAALDSQNVVRRSVTELVAWLSQRGEIRLFPAVPYHASLPKKTTLSVDNACNAQYCLSLFAHRMQEVCASAREFVTAKDRLDSLDAAYVLQFPELYRVSTVQLQVVLRCGSTFGNKCTHPITVSVPRSVSQFQTTVESAMNTNRQERSNVLASVITQLLDSSAVHCAHLEYVAAELAFLFSTISDYAPVVGLRADLLRESGRNLFYHVISSVSSLEMLFPATADSFAFVLKKLGQNFIANRASEQSRLMSVALGCQHLMHLLSPHFTPECVPPSELVAIYTSLSQAIRTPSSSSAALALLSRLDIKNAGERLPPQQFSELMPIAFENLISISDATSPLYTLCTKHFVHSLFHHFPTNFVAGLSLALSACDANAIPPSIFVSIIDYLGAHRMDDVNVKPEAVIDYQTCIDGSRAVANQFVVSRTELATRLYVVWSKYLDTLALLAEFFIYKAACLSFNPQLSTARIEGELHNKFEICTRLFGPLLEPFGTGTAPWNPNDVELAACVLDRFLSLLNRLHLLYDTYLPPGSENLEAILWQYYATRIAVLTAGCAHVYQILETRLTSIAWHTFWPNLAHLSSMEKVLRDGASECAPLATQIFVRIPWLAIIQQQAYQPIDASRAFFGLLFSIIVHCTRRPSCYSVCPASLQKLFAMLSSCEWKLVRVDELRAISAHIVSSFPATALTEQSEVMVSFFTLYRRICFFSTVPSNAIPLAEEYEKQAVYLRTRLGLMQRNPNDSKWAASFYIDEIKVINAIILSRRDSTKLGNCLSREITACWSMITDTKLGEALVKGLCEWLELNSDSHLILLIMNTVVESLFENQIVTGLKVVEKCIVTFFHRPAAGKWETIVEWASLPDSCQKYLFALPSSEKSVMPLLLTMNAFLLQRLQKCTSLPQETALLKMLFDYVSNVKPKYIDDEAAFILLLDKIQNLAVRQYGYDVRAGNEFLTHYLEWLERVYSDDKNSSFLSKLLVKKQPFALRTRLFCHVFHLYLTQQTVSPEQPLRSAVNSPVLNSRLQAFKEMCTMKAYSTYSSAFGPIQPFFYQFQTYHVGHLNELFSTVVRSLFSENSLVRLYAPASLTNEKM